MELITMQKLFFSSLLGVLLRSPHRVELAASTVGPSQDPCKCSAGLPIPVKGAGGCLKVNYLTPPFRVHHGECDHQGCNAKKCSWNFNFSYQLLQGGCGKACVWGVRPLVNGAWGFPLPMTPVPGVAHVGPIDWDCGGSVGWDITEYCRDAQGDETTQLIESLAFICYPCTGE